MRSFRIGPARPAVKLQCAARKAAKATPRIAINRTIVASGLAEDAGVSNSAEFHASIRVPTSASCLTALRRLSPGTLPCCSARTARQAFMFSE